MTLKKWLLSFFGILLGCGLLFAAFNVVLDPFGVFGDRFLDWYDYDMTLNPRVAKIGYLDQHYQEYDSYVVGSSKASSLSPTELNEYLDARFFNMTWYGGDLLDEKQLVHYIVKNYNVKNIVLAIDPQVAVFYNREDDPIKGNMHCKVNGSFAPLFYGKYLFANPSYGWEKLKKYFHQGYLTTSATVYSSDTGTYNKQLRDAVPINDMDDYLAREKNIVEKEYAPLSYIDEAMADVAEIRDLCDENGIRLIVVGVPIYNDDFYHYDQEQLAEFWTRLADTVEFYSFWGNNSVNSDIRYYYDSDHFRNNAGTMALAKIFNNPDVYVPDNFGQYITPETVQAVIEEAQQEPEPVDPDSYTAHVPVLMYHSFTEDPDEITDMTASIDDFEAQLAALTEAGYHPVLYADLIDYVYHGVELPDKPLVISIDDGYQNNLDLAVPLLEKYGFKASIAVIGCSEGKDTYKDTDTPIIPHFQLEDAAKYLGTLEIQSHSYDMHQVQNLDGEDCRQGVLQMAGEKEEDYIDTLTGDYLRSKERIESALGVECNVFTYPYGYCSTLSEVLLHSLGVKVTTTMNPGVNEIIKGIPQSLYQLKRINVVGGMTSDELLDTLDGLLSPAE